MWAYPAYTFVSARITAKALASFCSAERVQHVRLGGVGAAAEFRGGQISWTHIPSRSEYARIALDWPATVYTAHLTNYRVNPPFGYLVGQHEVPSFPSFSGAFSAFFYDRFAVTGTQNPELGQITIRFVDDQARIRRVRVGLTSLRVSVGGRAVRGACLALNSSDYRTTAAVDAAELALPLPGGGLPSDAWLWLKRESQWLDYRPLSQWGGRFSTDIQFDLPKDPVAEITRLASQGEGAQLEYKEKLPDTRDEKRKVFKTVVAFANGSGGKILFGVEDETHRITGVQGKLPELRQRLTDLLRDLVKSLPSCRG